MAQDNGYQSVDECPVPTNDSMTEVWDTLDRLSIWTVHCHSCRDTLRALYTAGDLADKARKHGWKTRVVGTMPAIWLCRPCDVADVAAGKPSMKALALDAALSHSTQ